MLVPTMTPEEIRDEINKDVDLIFWHISNFQKNIVSFSRLPIRKFPFFQNKKIVSKKTNMTYEFVIYTPNKYRQKTPSLFIYAKYTHKWGTTFAEILPDDGKFEYRIYTPHFIKRYRERMHLNESVTIDEVFMRFRVNNMATGRMDDFIIDNAEKYYHDRETEYYANIIPEGACICERDITQADIIIHNTFISREMFFETQEKGAKMFLIGVLWRSLLMNYPRQRDALMTKLDEFASETKDENELLKVVTQFIDKY